jgi:hypothetical protein
VYVVEQNRDAQMAALIRMDLDPAPLWLKLSRSVGV